MKLTYAILTVITLIIGFLVIEHNSAIDSEFPPEDAETITINEITNYIDSYEELVIKIKQLNVKTHGYNQLIDILNRSKNYDSFTMDKAYDISSIYDYLRKKQRIQIYIEDENQSLALIQILVSDETNSYILKDAEVVWE